LGVGVLESNTETVEETDAGLDKPLYTRNKMYNKNLKPINAWAAIVNKAAVRKVSRPRWPPSNLGGHLGQLRI